MNLAEAEKIKKIWIKQNILVLLSNSLFGVQKECLEDRSRLKALLASRRFGKSYFAAIYLIYTALSKPNVKCLYLALTRDSAEGIMWKDNLEVILNKFNINHKLNQNKLSITFDNGSSIHLKGVDKDERQIAKLRGQKYALCVIDECQDFQQDLRELVYKVLKLASIDLQGTILLCGTPGNAIETDTFPLFYSVTNNLEKLGNWNVFKGNTLDNPFMRDNFQKEIDEEVRLNPEFLNSITYKQEYLGQWVLNKDKLVYKFYPAKNVIDKLQHPLNEYIYLAGIDFGYNDSMAFTIGAYHRFDPTLYIIETYKKNKMLISDVEIKLKEFSDRYKIQKYICDTATQIVEELRHRLHYNFVFADKQHKFNFISLMNSDLHAGKIKLLPGNDLLKAEWNSLLYDSKSVKFKELSSCENHLCDSTLYLWRAAKNYLAKAPPIKITLNDKDYVEKRLEAKLISKRNNELYEDNNYLTDAEIDFGSNYE